jgi:hypothetical protein
MLGDDAVDLILRADLHISARQTSTQWRGMPRLVASIEHYDPSFVDVAAEPQRRHPP